MSAAPPDDPRKLKTGASKKAPKQQHPPSKQQKSSSAFGTNFSNLRFAEENPKAQQTTGQQTDVSANDLGETNNESFAPHTKTELGFHPDETALKLAIDIEFGDHFNPSNFDLIIVPFGETGLPQALNSNPPFSDPNTIAEILEGTNAYSARSFVDIRHGLALFNILDQDANFEAVIQDTLPNQLSIFGGETARILDTTLLGTKQSVPILEHIERAIGLFSAMQRSLSYTLLIPASVRADEIELVQKELIELPLHSQFHKVEIGGFTHTDSNSTPAGGKEPIRATTRSNLESDHPSPNDYLGFKPIAKSLAAFVKHKGTELPLCIAIDGPWGTGKSSMMLMIQEALQKGSTKARKKLSKSPGLFASLWRGIRLVYLTWEPLLVIAAAATLLAALAWWIWASTPVPSVTVKGIPWYYFNLLYLVVTGTSWAFRQGQNVRRRDSSTRHFETVTINAWRYGDGVRLKAAIVQSIITDLMERRNARFFLKLQLSRLNRVALMTSLTKWVFQSWTFAILAVLSGLAILVADQVENGTNMLNSMLGVFGIDNLKAQHADSILGIVLAATGLAVKLGGKEKVANVGDFIANPNYASLVGPDEEVEEDFRRILHLLEEEGYALALFIDDLDRCSPDAVHKVVEALNVFFGQPDCRCLFILGMHKEMVATALEVAYGPIAAKLAGNCLLDEQRPFGRRFLEKIVQFVLHVPKPRHDQVQAYVKHLTLGLTTNDIEDLIEEASAPRAPLLAQASARLSRMGTRLAHLWRSVLAWLRLTSRPQVEHEAPPVEERLAELQQDEAMAREIKAAQERLARRQARLAEAADFSEGSEKNRDIFEQVRPALGHNPRQYKRFFNQLRFNRFITEDRIPDSDVVSLHTDAIMAAVALEFPEAYQWAYTNLDPKEGERNIDAALRHLKEKARKALPAHVKDLDTAKDIEDRVHFLLKQHPNLVHLIKLTATKAAA